MPPCYLTANLRLSRSIFQLLNCNATSLGALALVSRPTLQLGDSTTHRTKLAGPPVTRAACVAQNRLRRWPSPPLWRLCTSSQAVNADCKSYYFTKHTMRKHAVLDDYSSASDRFEKGDKPTNRRSQANTTQSHSPHSSVGACQPGGWHHLIWHIGQQLLDKTWYVHA
jgi:hypothetical protein